MTGNVPEFWMSKTYLKRVVRIFPRVFYSLNIFIPIRLSLPTSIFGNEKIIEGKKKRSLAKSFGKQYYYGRQLFFHIFVMHFERYINNKNVCGIFHLKPSIFFFSFSFFHKTGKREIQAFE